MEPTNTQLQEGLKDNIPYDVIELPSKGLFYKNKKASVTIITHENLEKNYNNLLLNLIKNKFVIKKPTFIRIEKI